MPVNEPPIIPLRIGAPWASLGPTDLSRYRATRRKRTRARNEKGQSLTRNMCGEVCADERDVSAVHRSSKGKRGIDQDGAGRGSRRQDVRTTNRTLVHLAVICSGSVALLLAALSNRIIEKQKPRKQPRYRRIALLKHINNSHNTPCRRILTFGLVGDFILSINFTKSVLLEYIHSIFETERMKVNYGSPYLTARWQRGRKLQLESVDLMRLVLWYLKSKDCAYRLCPIFGIVPSTLSTWLQYFMKVLLRAMKNSSKTSCRITLTNKDEIQDSQLLLRQNTVHGRLLRGIFGVVDGGRMRCASYTEPNLYRFFLPTLAMEQFPKNYA